MYNSKKALELAILEYEKDLEYEETNQWVENVLKGLKDLKQDLEKLEKENQQLNQTIQTIRQNTRNDYISHQEEINNSKEEFDHLLDKYYELGDENAKLKKAIEILKRFNFTIFNTKNNNNENEFRIYTDSLLETQVITKGEYELLKEVFENE